MANKNLVNGISNILSRESRRGIDVTIEDDRLIIDVYVIVEYGTRIRVVAESIQNTVKFHVEKAIGIPVGAVNVYVHGFKTERRSVLNRLGGERVSLDSAQLNSAPLASGQKWLTCNGQQLAKMARAGLATLEQNQQKVNDLNVFPVPDGDTGTNMLLTMRAAWRRIENNRDEHVGNIAHELSYGALMGARGNSGVILSQIWRGLAKGLKDKETFDANDLAIAMRESSDTAYKGVMRPVEGTILTVIREGAEEAEDAVEIGSDLRFLLARIVERCEQSLARTPDLLPVLKQAGVVDAGGAGIIVHPRGNVELCSWRNGGIHYVLG